MGKLIPLILVVLGVGGGAAAGFLLKPAAEETVEIDPCGDTEGAAAHAAAD
ncbi:MAG: flagellar basal body-associated protein FliL, partial [Gemmatimonadetes bacterium]|nr:flagellar basal body-associated protein FliL [Gemmatimonadota bacterium]NIT66386.1 flagellar basal body-associated protein FliL [Gemmatimonadota bacterium]NIW74797.1 flagellar basal body-associated protein FliL [Gemmatimonadota bacterium]NIY34963.1 flagellar basal body-associated protein FliL [Gemmatimonadota bacterium]